MTKDVGIILLGLIIAATPFLGFPSSWKTIIFVVAGLLAAFLAFLMRGELTYLRERLGGRKGDTFVQNDTTFEARDDTELSQDEKKESHI